jgi:hypothetical protein
MLDLEPAEMSVRPVLSMLYFLLLPTSLNEKCMRLVPDWFVCTTGPQGLEIVECPLITYQSMTDHSRISFQIHAGTNIDQVAHLWKVWDPRRSKKSHLCSRTSWSGSCSASAVQTLIFVLSYQMFLETVKFYGCSHIDPKYLSQFTSEFEMMSYILKIWWFALTWSTGVYYDWEERKLA